MENSIHIKDISQLNQFLNQPKPLHPLVGIIDFSKVDNFGEDGVKISSGFYSMMFKNHCHNKLKYGRKYFDFQEGTLICIAPN